jgi:hypothetical protein
MSPDETIDTQRKENSRLKKIIDDQAQRIEHQAQRIEHQAQRIDDVAFRYKAMFGMDALYQRVFPERVPSSLVSSGWPKNAWGCSNLSASSQGALSASGCGSTTLKPKNA